MARKSQVIRNEQKVIAEKAEQLIKLAQEAEAEEFATLARVEKQVSVIAEEANVFLGVVLTKQDLFNVLDLMISTKDKTVQIPAKAYFKE